jgi:hypothetical protein
MEPSLKGVGVLGTVIANDRPCMQSPLVGVEALASKVASDRLCYEASNGCWNTGYINKYSIVLYCIVGVGYSNSWRQVMNGTTSGCWLQ